MNEVTDLEDEDDVETQFINESIDLQQQNANLIKARDMKKKEVDGLLLEKALDYFPLGITIKDVQGKVIYTNYAEAELHGYKVEEIMNREAKMFAPQELWKPLTPEQVNGFGIWKRESLNLYKDGKVFPVQLTSNIIRSDKGIPVGIVTVCEDITERKRIEEALKKSEKELKKRVKELEEFYEIAVGRELKMKELKEEIEELKKELRKYKEQ